MDFLFSIETPERESFKIQISFTFCTIDRNATNRWLRGGVINNFTFTYCKKKNNDMPFQTSEYNIINKFVIWIFFQFIKIFNFKISKNYWINFLMLNKCSAIEMIRYT